MVLFSLPLDILVIFHDTGWLETKEIIENLVKFHYSGWFTTIYQNGQLFILMK